MHNLINLSRFVSKYVAKAKETQRQKSRSCQVDCESRSILDYIGSKSQPRM